MYKDQSYSVSDSIGIPDQTTYFSEYTLTKFVSAWSIKYGVVNISRNGFIFDSYIGLGRRNKNANTSLTEEQDKYIIYEPENSSIYNSSSGGIWLNIILGFKIGWIIK